MKIAKVRHRIMATILDSLIVFAIMFILLIGVWPSFVYALFKDISISFSMMLTLVRVGTFYALFLLFYYMVIPIFIKGQTIGKKVFKIKIVCENGKDVDYKVLFFREAICRILIRTLSFGISSLVSILIMCIRDDNKSVGDVFAQTKVIDIKGEM